MEGREIAAIVNARVPVCLLDGHFEDADEGLARVDIDIQAGRIAAVHVAGSRPEPADAVRQDGGQVWPGLVDCHTHLDKGHIWPRAPNPDGSFASALEAVRGDWANWSAEDQRRRFEFALRCAWAHGTVAIRTHLDSPPQLYRTSWAVFRELRAEWAARIALQAVSLVTIDDLRDPAFAEELADAVAQSGGVFGCVTFMTPGIDRQLDRIFALARERALDLDCHVDESLDPGARSLQHIARAALRNRFAGRLLCGHCCSLAVQPEDEAARTVDLVAEAGIAIVSLPMCNLYLQDRVPGRTPRRRGVTLLHEMAARGIPVALASDNCRDPFYAWGDHDLVEVFREGTRIAHLDHPTAPWPAAVTRTPASIMRLQGRGIIGPGAPADLVLFKARHWSELLARPQADRTVLRAGRPIDARPPDYRELDGQVCRSG